MNLVHLALRPRRFFERQPDGINWVWPLAGFYLFAFGSFFQHFVVHEYRMPYWLVVFVVAWAPTFTLVLGFFVLLVLLWYWPASTILGTPQGFARSTKAVGIALLVPGILFSGTLLTLATVKSNGFAAPYQLIVGAVHVTSGLWALALMVVAAMVSNGFTRKTAALFVLWLAALIALLGAFVYAVLDRS